MKLQKRIELLAELGKQLHDPDNKRIQSASKQAQVENQWFTQENISKSLAAISSQFLQQDLLEDWTAQYNLENIIPKKVGLVLAGNIPLVGFHDLLCCFICSHNSIIKTSSKDRVLIEAIVDLLIDMDQSVKDYFEFTDRLTEFDAVIATGSNNSAIHFDYYFRNYPKIIRKNRSSIAILSGSESREELEQLAGDIFDYFGLGCRNISKVYLPEGFDMDHLFKSFHHYDFVLDHHKYRNNFDYNQAIFLLSREKYLTNDFIALKEDESIHSRIASLHYEYYGNLKETVDQIDQLRDQIQCISSNMQIPLKNVVPLGTCQTPGLNDYADDIDTMSFLTKL